MSDLATQIATMSAVMGGPEYLPLVAQYARDYVGIVMPFITDYVNQKIESSKIRFILSLVVPVIATVLLNADTVLEGGWGTLIAKSSFIIVQSQIMYKLYWEKSNMRYKLFS